MNVNPGELRKRIQIIRLVVSDETNENGFPLPPREEVIRRPWAKVTHRSGTEIITANSEFSETKQRFLVRWFRNEIGTDCFVRYAGKDYDVEYVNDYNDAHEYLEIWTGLKERTGAIEE